MTRNPSRTIPILLLFAAMAVISVSVAMPQSASGGRGSRGSDAGTVNSGGPQALTTNSTTASRWTAGASNFGSAGMNSSGSTGGSSGRTWNAGVGSFGSTVQPGGIWRTTAAPSVVSPAIVGRPGRPSILMGTRKSATGLSSSTGAPNQLGLGRPTQSTMSLGSRGRSTASALQMAPGNTYGRQASPRTSSPSRHAGSANAKGAHRSNHPWNGPAPDENVRDIFSGRTGRDGSESAPGGGGLDDGINRFSRSGISKQGRPGASRGSGNRRTGP